MWLHDYGRSSVSGSPMAAPERVAGLIIQNGDIYADTFGPKYDFLKRIWENPGPDARRRIAQHVTLAGFESEFRGELPDDVADRISPDLWTLHWSLMSTPERVANLIHLLEDQPSTLDWFSRGAGLPSRAQAADADRVGPARRLHAGGIGARLPSRPARRPAASTRRRSLAAGDPPRRGGPAGGGLPGRPYAR